MARPYGAANRTAGMRYRPLPDPTFVTHALAPSIVLKSSIERAATPG